MATYSVTPSLSFSSGGISKTADFLCSFGAYSQLPGVRLPALIIHLPLYKDSEEKTQLSKAERA